MVAVLTWTGEVESFNSGVWVEADRPGRVARDRVLPYKVGATDVIRYIMISFFIYFNELLGLVWNSYHIHFSYQSHMGLILHLLVLEAFFQGSQVPPELC